MHKYPNIDQIPIVGEKVWAFDKLDGSNVRAEWSGKRQEFYKYGSRGQLIDQARDPILGKAPGLIKAKYETSVRDVIIPRARDLGSFDHAVFYFEFIGTHSFAGRHHPDDQFDVILFDIWHQKHGFLGPELFCDITTDLHIAPLLYTGECCADLVERVRTRSLPGMIFEGVVCKTPNKFNPTRWKIKSDEWKAKLREYCGSDQDLFLKLE